MDWSSYCPAPWLIYPKLKTDKRRAESKETAEERNEVNEKRKGKGGSKGGTKARDIDDKYVNEK